MEDLPKRSSGKRNKKRKFTGNIHTRTKVPAKNVDLNESASAKKINLSSDEMLFESDVTASSFQGYRIIDIGIMFSYIEKYLCCRKCGSSVTVKENIVCGLSSKISMDCQNCSELCKFRNSRMLGAKLNVPEINRRYMYAMRSIGMGLASMKLFCGLMDLPPPFAEKSYNKMVKRLLTCTDQVAKNSKQSAAEEEARLTCSPSVIISGDGTWKTRGHTSRVGVCTVIGDRSGKVLDTEVLSTFCKGCDSWKVKKGSPEYNEWKLLHKKECLINHTGSAGKMESIGMVRIFQRSETLHGLKYVGYIGDGDAKTFQTVVEATPYGSNLKIQKIECVGHIQKRMGTRLRRLKQSAGKCSDGKSVGGKGRLTDKVIDKLTIYYGNAIREHKNSLSEMRKAVWAVYFHTRSTDAEPLHSFCPNGPDSWCGYQKAIAVGSGINFVHKKTLPLCVMDVIKPIFNDLSHPKLLERCLGGKTQNNNESLNSLIWKLCPKTKGSGKRIVEIATNEAVVLFNEGNRGKLKVMQQFGLTTGPNVKTCLSQLDKQRIATAEIRFLQNTKEMRRIKRRGQKVLEEIFLSNEGKMYATGEF